MNESNMRTRIRVAEIQRLRTLADLLELNGSIEEDVVLTKEDIRNQILDIIKSNFLHESPDSYD